MKKNITVNIFGTLYPIDEDAYELLQKYNDNMRRYYSQREGGYEIADDVEMRVAELLSELRQSGVQAITIEHITEIINRIGDPQQMDENANGGIDEDTTPPPFGDDNANSHEQTQTGGAAFNATTKPDIGTTGDKKLFRDPEDRIIGGVLSGLSHYLGIKDPLILRIAVVVLFFLSFSSLAILYVIGWILIPEAVTPEDRLRMYGKPVTATAINEELMRGVNSAKEFVNRPGTRNAASGCLSVIAKIFAFFIVMFIIIIVGSTLLAVAGSLIGISLGSIGLPFSHFDFNGVNIDFRQLINTVPTWMIGVCIASWLCVLCLPLYGIIRTVLHRKDSPGMATATKVALVVTWMVCLFAGISTGAVIAKKVGNQIHTIDQKLNTREGIHLSGQSWDLLTKKGWTLQQFKGINDNLVEWGELPDNEYDRYIRLSTAGNPNDMVYDLHQEKELTDGNYIIDCWVKANGTGNVLYVTDATGKEILRCDIPMYKTSEPSTDTIPAISSPTASWTHLTQNFSIPITGTIKYGITNKSEMSASPWNGDRIDIANVKILREP